METKFEHLVPCTDFKGKFWVFGIISSGNFDEACLEGFARDHIEVRDVPFVVGCNGFVPELYVAYRCAMKDRHKPKLIQGMAPFTITKGGNMSIKVIQSIETVFTASSHIFTNIEIQKGQEPAVAQSDQMTYEQAEAIVINWGTQKFTSFVQNAGLAVKQKQKLNELQFVCLNCKGPLLDVIKLRGCK